MSVHTWANIWLIGVLLRDMNARSKFFYTYLFYLAWNRAFVVGVAAATHLLDS